MQQPPLDQRNALLILQMKLENFRMNRALSPQAEQPVYDSMILTTQRELAEAAAQSMSENGVQALG